MTETSPIRASGFFVFRTPLLPFEEFARWSEGLEAPSRLSEPDLLPQALAKDTERLRVRLAALVDRLEVKEALFVASPDLVQALNTWRADPSGAKGRRVERSLVRYFARMVARPTPFGLFAGCSVGTIGAETRLETGPLSSYRRHARLDTYYLTELGEAIARDPVLQAELRYRLNSSLYRIAGRLRYAESSAVGGSRAYRLVAVEDSPHLAKVSERGAQGAALRELTECLIDDEITAKDAALYVQELVEAQVLVPDILPVVTGHEPIHDLLEQLRQHAVATPVRARLDAAQHALEALDQTPLGIEAERYCAVAAGLAELPAPVKMSTLLQVDMIKPAPNASLGHAVIDEIARTVELLHGIRRAGDRFQFFRERFRDRYERQAVPLLDVLDEENGIGFESAAGPEAEPSPLLEGLRFPVAEGSDTGAAWSSLDRFLLGKLCEATAAGARILELEAAELERHKSSDKPPLPDAFFVSATLGAASAEALARGDFTLVFSRMAGPSGARLLGRFCHVDAVLNEYVRAHLRDEEALAPEAVYAEIVHLPEGRAGNVILRPVLREYEIPFLGRSGAPQERQIAVSDLLIAIEGERIVLRSGRLGREVIPRLTNAHNFAHGPGIYRFLCALQQQSAVAMLGWSWGRLESAPFLPRVVAGKTVLSRAQWRVERRELDEMVSGDDLQTYRQLAAWREWRGIQRYVALVDGDNKLLFDLDNVLSAQTLIHYVRRRPYLLLEEFYPEQAALCSAGPEGHFVHELVVPFICRSRATPVRPAVARVVTAAATRDRHFPPGSEWLYAKLYSGTATADLTLREVVAPLVREMSGTDGIDQWFFVRYGDPQWHLRVRFHGTPEVLRERLLPRLYEACQPLQENGALAKIQLDTYQREIERYGGTAGMCLAERFFWINSEAALHVIELVSGDGGADARWRIALLGMDMLLDDLGFDLEARLRLAQSGKAGYLKQLRVDNRDFRHRLGDRYRKQQRALKELLDSNWADESPLAAAVQVLRRQSERFRSEVAAPLRKLLGDGLTTSLESVASSYLHMHVNRFTRSAAVPQELVVYDFLSRLYESRLARLAKSAARP